MLKTSYCDYLCSVAVVMNFDEGRNIVDITRSGKRKIKKYLWFSNVFHMWKLFILSQKFSLTLSGACCAVSLDTVNAGWFIWENNSTTLSTKSFFFFRCRAVFNPQTLYRIEFTFLTWKLFLIHFCAFVNKELLYHIAKEKLNLN